MSDLDRLIADLEVAGPKAEAAAYKAVHVEAHNMKTDWQKTVTGARGLPGLPGALSYDVHVRMRTVEAEVGYDKRGQGELGNIAEFGTSTQGPKRPAGKRVLEDGADRLERYLDGMDPL